MASLNYWGETKLKGRVPEGDRLICSNILRNDQNDLWSLRMFVYHNIP